MTPKTIWLLGCGRMGRALLRGLLSAGDNCRLTVIDPKATALAGEFGSAADFTTTPPNQGVADALIIALKPQKINAVLPDYATRISSSTMVLSMVAGKSAAELAVLLRCPVAHIARAMPNLPAAIGQGVTGLYCPAAMPAAARDLSAALVQGLGSVCVVKNEVDLNAVTALSGSGPAYVFALCEAMRDAGIAQGLPPELAQELAQRTLIGSANMLQQPGADPALLRQQVTSPGGTTAAALDVLREQRWAEILSRAIAAATTRSRELADG